ncbi:hypothetical protein MNB_SV-6-1076 [hydrothermal vent metagenome]|uniref:Cell division protein ZapB n=1 Tax=hydrothermal vent metagenome TaxID=652676 RepID=A0A1W1B8T1_9ZZZZ
MTALQRLQEKIEQLKNNYHGMQHEIYELKQQLEALHNSQGEKQGAIDQLRAELDEKDREIEGIISKVEDLLA